MQVTVSIPRDLQARRQAFAGYQLISGAAPSHHQRLYEAYLAYALGKLGYSIVVECDPGLVGVWHYLFNGYLQQPALAFCSPGTKGKFK